MVAPFRSYLICATPRSGSTMLCDLLADTGVSGRPNSFYRRQDIQYWTALWGVTLEQPLGSAAFERTFLDAVRRYGSSDNGVFGIRVMFGTLAELLDRLETLFPGSSALEKLEYAFGPIVFIHLSRQDKVAQAVSRLRAELSGLWHRSADGSERERSGPGQEVAYDFNRLSAFVKEATEDDSAWTDFFARNRITPLQLNYETFTSAPKAELARVLAALGENPKLADAVTVRTAKLADTTSQQWMAPCRAQRALAATCLIAIRMTKTCPTNREGCVE